MDVDVDFLLKITAVFTGVAAIALLIMMGAMIATWRSVSKLQGRANTFMDRWEPVAESSQQTLADVRKHSNSILGKVDELTDSTKAQVDRVDKLVTQLADTANKNIDLVDTTMRKTMERVDNTAAAVEKTVRAPVDQVRALTAGVNAAIQQLAQKRSRPIDRIAADEELFL